MPASSARAVAHAALMHAHAFSCVAATAPLTPLGRRRFLTCTEVEVRSVMASLTAVVAPGPWSSARAEDGVSDVVVSLRALRRRRIRVDRHLVSPNAAALGGDDFPAHYLSGVDHVLFVAPSAFEALRALPQFFARDGSFRYELGVLTPSADTFLVSPVDLLTFRLFDSVY